MQIAVGKNLFRRALTLGGISAALRAQIPVVAPPPIRRQLDSLLATAHAQLSPEEAERAWRVGQMMTLDEAVEFAVNRVGQ